jgi:thymidylate synthase
MHRVPCTLGYLFEPEGNKLHMTYFMRSCDWKTHYQNDVYLALRLQQYVVEQTNKWRDRFIPGEFCHFIGNLHVFAKDVEGVF